MKKINRGITKRSKKPECTNSSTGSCCFTKDLGGEQKCIDGISCVSCKERGGSWSTSSCIRRKNDLEAGCCKTCYKLPKNINLAPINKKFRTRITEQKILPEDDATNTSECEINYENDIKICESCIELNSVCKNICEKITMFIKNICADRKQAIEKANQVNTSEVLQRYYSCVAKNKKEHAHALRGALSSYACICTNEVDIYETELYKQFERINSLYFSHEQNCKKLLPEVFTDTIEEKENSLGCCCQYVKQGETESTQVGSRKDDYKENDLIRCSCLNYFECISNRAFYDICWSAECEQCEKEKEGDRTISTGCSGKENSENCSCCKDKYTDTRCFTLKNENPEIDTNCWLRLFDSPKQNCWVRVPAVCNTCQDSWLGVSVRDGKTLSVDDISNTPKNECSLDSCTQKMVKESDNITCGVGCDCGSTKARNSEDNICKRITVEISSTCPDANILSRKRIKQNSIFLPLVSNCCECDTPTFVRETSTGTRSGQVTSTYTPTSSPASSPTPSPPQQGSGSAGSGSYGY